MVAEPQAEAFSLSDESTGGVSVYALTDDGQLEGGIVLRGGCAAVRRSGSCRRRSFGRPGRAQPSGKFVVALDPGHGGSEPGASANGLVGEGAHMEDRVVLQGGAGVPMRTSKWC